jgi:hypothetical protein
MTRNRPWKQVALSPRIPFVWEVRWEERPGQVRSFVAHSHEAAAQHFMHREADYQAKGGTGSRLQRPRMYRFVLAAVEADAPTEEERAAQREADYGPVVWSGDSRAPDVSPTWDDSPDAECVGSRDGSPLGGLPDPPADPADVVRD